jgi:hypothetical protein
MKTRTYAEILARQGEYREAIAIYRHLLAKDPNDVAIPRRIAELEALADPDAAALAEVATLAPPSAEGQGRVRRRHALETLLQRIQSRRRP